MNVKLTNTTFQKRKTPILYPCSVFMINIRSIFNKFDELNWRLSSVKPFLAIVCEMWLDEDTPDSALFVSGCKTVRSDKNYSGGGILCYISDAFSFRTISTQEVSSISSYNSEILPILFPSAILIAVYHPFWNNPREHEDAVSCITDIIDYIRIPSCLLLFLSHASSFVVI